MSDTQSTVTCALVSIPNTLIGGQLGLEQEWWSEREVENNRHDTPFLLGHITANDACMLKHPLWVMSRASCLVLSSPVHGSSEIHKLTIFPMAAHSDWGAKVRIAYMEYCLLSLKAYQLSRIEYIFFKFICWFVTAKWASLIAGKELPVMQETLVQFLDWEDHLEEGMATHSSILAWRIPKDKVAWWATVQGVARDMTEWLSIHTQLQNT